MTDELTPEEKEALENLPRERMPVGLEARVVEAMREHGFLARRRRTITMTNSRVAGVLAASVALMIGAYSIGLHRGGGSAMLPPAPTVQRDTGTLAEMPAEPRESKQTAAEKAAESAPPVARDAEEKRLAEPKTGKLAAPTAPPASSDEARENRAEPVRPEAEAREPGREAAAAPTEEKRLRQGRSDAPSARVPSPATAPSVTSMQPLTFLLNGTSVVVEAPDSVRVVQDERGRMLIIYTSDGIIRIRLADDP